MKRLVVLLAGLTVLASASYASARPLAPNTSQRARIAARIIAKDTQAVLQNALMEQRRGIRRPLAANVNLQPLYALDRAADQLVVALNGASTFRMNQALAAVETSFARARVALPFIRHSPYAQAQFEDAGRWLYTLRPLVNELMARYRPVPPMPVLYPVAVAPVPPAPPPALPTTVYSTGGATVSWYQAR